MSNIHLGLSDRNRFCQSTDHREGATQLLGRATNTARVSRLHIRFMSLISLFPKYLLSRHRSEALRSTDSESSVELDAASDAIRPGFDFQINCGEDLEFRRNREENRFTIESILNKRSKTYLSIFLLSILASLWKRFPARTASGLGSI